MPEEAAGLPISPLHGSPDRVSLRRLHNGRHHEYLPDFIVRLAGDAERFLILEIKGYDPLKDVKAQAAERWVRAVNAGGGFGVWGYAVVSEVGKVGEVVGRRSRGRLVFRWRVPEARTWP